MKEGQRDREQDRSDWKREGIGTGPSASSGVGEHETPARYPSAANTCTRKDVTSLRGIDIEQTRISSTTAVVVSKHACQSNDDILQLV